MRTLMVLAAAAGFFAAVGCEAPVASNTQHVKANLHRRIPVVLGANAPRPRYTEMGKLGLASLRASDKVAYYGRGDIEAASGERVPGVVMLGCDAGGHPVLVAIFFVVDGGRQIDCRLAYIIDYRQFDRLVEKDLGFRYYLD